MMAKIVSGDGMPRESFVELEDGRRLQGVTEINWRIAVDDVGRADIALGIVAIDVLGVLTVLMQHPTEGDMRPVRRIEFADGTSWEGPEA